MKRKKILWLLIIGLLIAMLIAGAVLYMTASQPDDKARQMQQYRDAKMEQYRQENARFADYEVEVAFLGDSLTDLYDVEKYYPQYVTSNRGIGGDTTFDLEERLQTPVYDLKPQVVVMLIGANNVETMFDNYESILKGLKENLPQTKVVLLSLTAMGGEVWGSRNPQAAYNNVTIELLAKKYGFYFIDLYSPLYDVSIREVYAGYTVDGGHFSDRGYEVITALITPVLQELLGK